MRIQMMLRAAAFVATLILASWASACWSGEADGLNGTAWILSELEGPSLLSDRQVTVRFEKGRILGTDGCNRYQVSYTAEGGKLQIGGNIVSTKMACEEPVMRQAEAFFGILIKVGGYLKESRRLVLLDVDGNPLATLREQRQELAASSWRVTAYNNGKQGVVSVLSDIEIIVHFGAGGALSGSAGCNAFNAIYATSGQGIKISRMAATKKICARPRGIMEQEAQFLRALETAAIWLLDGDRLELRTSRQSLAVTLWPVR